MKENKKKASLLTEEAGYNSSSFLTDEKKGTLERLKKTLIFSLMGIVCIGCMYLIFKPSGDKQKIEIIGLNDSVPQASASALQADKQKAYERELLEEKQRQKHDALTALSDYWNEEASPSKQVEPDEAEEPSSPALNSYRRAQNTLGSFYQQDNGETKELRRQLEELKQELAQKDIPPAATVDDQLELMEKSYQMAAKYLPSGSSTVGPEKNTPEVNKETEKKNFSPLLPAKKSGVSSLYRPVSDSTSPVVWNSDNNRFNSTGSAPQIFQQKNSVTACVHQSQTIIGDAYVSLRLLEPARISDRSIAAGAILTAIARIQPGRLQLKVSSIEHEGLIIPVEIIIYDLDGQQGIPVPYSAESSALNEMAGSMSQQSGTSLIMTQSAGQQMAADLSRGLVQGISGYFSKKVRTPKVTLKAGHKVFLVSKK